MTIPMQPGRPRQPLPPTPPEPELRLTARTPDDVIAMASLVLGFTPEESVVMLTFGATHPFHARVDLPHDHADRTDHADRADTAPYEELAEVLLDPAVRHRVARVVLLVYSGDGSRARAAWAALREGTRRRGLETVEAFWVTDRRWYPLLGGHRRTRELGVPYDVSAHPFLVRAVVEGRVTHGSRAALVASLHAEPDRVAAVSARLARRSPWPSVGEVDLDVLLAEGAWVESIVALSARNRTVLDDDAAARLVLAVQVVPLRDAAWCQVSRTGARGHVELWTDLVRRCPEALIAPVATILAWAAWQAGDGALAWCGLDRCVAVDPDYSLAQVLAGALTSATSPSCWDATADWRVGLAP